MAEPAQIEGVEGDTPFGEVAAVVVETRLAELVGHAEDVLDLERIEGVHDMRVATRRLRAALEVFAPCFPRGPYRAVLKEVKAIADALGERRDRDVAIRSLVGFSGSIPAPDRPGIRSLIARFRAEQEEANKALEEFVDEGRLRRLGEAVRELALAARSAGEGGEG